MLHTREALLGGYHRPSPTVHPIRRSGGVRNSGWALNSSVNTEFPNSTGAEYGTSRTVSSDHGCAVPADSVLSDHGDLWHGPAASDGRGPDHRSDVPRDRCPRNDRTRAPGPQTAPPSIPPCGTAVFPGGARSGVWGRFPGDHTRLREAGQHSVGCRDGTDRAVTGTLSTPAGAAPAMACSPVSGVRAPGKTVIAVDIADGVYADRPRCVEETDGPFHKIASLRADDDHDLAIALSIVSSLRVTGGTP